MWRRWRKVRKAIRALPARMPGYSAVLRIYSAFIVGRMKRVMNEREREILHLLQVQCVSQPKSGK